MPFIDSSLGSSLGWALIHSLWQCAVVGALAWLGYRGLRSRSAQSRYLLGCGALVLMLALPSLTFFLLWTPMSPVSTTGQDGLPAIAWITQSAANPAVSTMRPLLPWLLLAWAAGVFVMSLRLFGGWLWIQRLRWINTEPAEPQWQDRFGVLVDGLGITRPVRLMRSLAVEVPLVLGWLRPLVLVPAALFTAMEPLALEAILVHELAHVRRHDYLVNLLQSLVEVLLFFHPAVWWLSAQIRTERENCCDDIAIAHCGNSLLYARALTGLEALRPALESNPNLALAATGGTLMHRIRRILAPNLPPSSAARAGLIAALAVSVLGAASSISFHQQEPTPKAEAKKEACEEKKIITVRIDQDTKSPQKLKIEMKGKMKIQPEVKPSVALEEGARLKIEGKEGAQIRTYTAERSQNGEQFVWTLDGKEQAPDAQAEAWLKKSLESAQKFQFHADGKGHQKRIKVMVDAEDAAEHGKPMPEGHKKIIVIRKGKDGKTIDVEGDEHFDMDIEVDGTPGEEHRVFIQKGDPKETRREVMVFKGDHRNPKAEIEALKKAIEQMQKRLDRLQKDVGKPTK